MNVKFEIKAKKQQFEETETILVSGEKVGEMYLHNYQYGLKSQFYMAKLSVRGIKSPSSSVYGHGETKERAVIAALADGKKDALLTLEFIEKMELELADN